VDSRATNHVCNMMQRFQLTKELDEGNIYLILGDDTRVPVHSSGIVELYINFKCFYIIRLSKYIPSYTCIYLL
jgi:hypothetical protein